jgi:DNA-binding NarL/FixJ family response regulator
MATPLGKEWRAAGATQRNMQGAEVTAHFFAKFTAREYQILRVLRRGRRDKQIASELNMAEGTVMVHLRNIRKKLGARNRTEIVFLTRSLFS